MRPQPFPQVVGAITTPIVSFWSVWLFGDDGTVGVDLSRNLHAGECRRIDVDKRLGLYDRRRHECNIIGERGDREGYKKESTMLKMIPTVLRFRYD